MALAARLDPIIVRCLHRRLARLVQLRIQGPGFAMRPVLPDELVHD